MSTEPNPHSVAICSIDVSLSFSIRFAVSTGILVTNLAAVEPNSRANVREKLRMLVPDFEASSARHPKRDVDP